MTRFLSILLGLTLIASCVPAKKYKDLVEKEKLCSEELESYKTSSLNYEGKATDYMKRYEVLTKEVEILKADTARMGQDFRMFQAQCKKINLENKALEAQFANYRKTGELTTAGLQKDLESKNLELQRKQDVLNSLEKDLSAKCSRAQDRKLNMICKDILNLQPGEEHLDFGCGWGALVTMASK